jgi:hypothetical protein
MALALIIGGSLLVGLGLVYILGYLNLDFFSFKGPSSDTFSSSGESFPPSSSEGGSTDIPF